MANVQKNGLIADRYAEALAEIAKSDLLTYEKISADLKTIENILNQSPDLDEFLNNPLMSSEDKKEIINKVFTDEIDVLTVNFLKILIDKNRFSIFREIINSYNKILDSNNNVSRIQVTSAVILTDDAKVRLKAKLEAKLKKSVTLDWDINPEIIAGLVIKMGDNIIDTSLKHKLEDLNKAITK